MSSSKRTNVPPKEWAKHLRPFGKKGFWSSVRNLFRSEEKEEMIQEIDVEELKRNKEEYERELKASLNAEDITNEITGDPGHEFPEKPNIWLIPCPKGITPLKEVPDSIKTLREIHPKF